MNKIVAPSGISPEVLRGIYLSKLVKQKTVASPTDEKLRIEQELIRLFPEMKGFFTRRNHSI